MLPTEYSMNTTYNLLTRRHKRFRISQQAQLIIAGVAMHVVLCNILISLVLKRLCVTQQLINNAQVYTELIKSIHFYEGFG